MWAYDRGTKPASETFTKGEGAAGRGTGEVPVNRG